MTDATFGSTDDSGSTTDQVKDQVRDKAQMAQDKARGAMGQARGRLSDQVDQRSTQAGERIAGTASDVRSIAEELRSQGKDAPATLAEQVAGQADRVGDYLKGASGDRILRDVEDFARRQPMLVAASGLVLGLRCFAVPQGLQQPPLRVRYGDSGTAAWTGPTPVSPSTAPPPALRPTTPRRPPATAPRPRTRRSATRRSGAPMTRTRSGARRSATSMTSGGPDGVV